MPQEEPSLFKTSLQEMYDLGVKHGYTLAEKEMEIERLQKEVEAINLKIFEKSLEEKT